MNRFKSRIKQLEKKTGAGEETKYILIRFPKQPFRDENGKEFIYKKGDFIGSIVVVTKGGKPLLKKEEEIIAEHGYEKAPYANHLE